MPRIYTWTEDVVSTDGAGVTTHRKDVRTQTLDDTYLATLAEAQAETAVIGAAATEDMMTRMLVKTVPPQTILPGSTDLALMPDDSVLSVGANGEVYADGLRLGQNAVAKLVRVGKSVYGLGKTVRVWWKWTGTTWAPAPDVDPNLLS